ncbi:MAG: D-alanyl-D-alanine carboxypeptidase [Oscillospiraceae bacterium]|nr:D-alanyl-D-alanine carboxypeptidase [Oscillospiraceae bacterium]
MAQTQKRNNKQAALRRSKIIGWISIIFLLAVFGIVIWVVASLISQARSNIHIETVEKNYTKLEPLPTLSEKKNEQKLEELARVDKILEPKDSYPLEADIQTPYFIMYDVEGEEVLFAKNSAEKAYPASTTKIITSALLMEYAPEDTIFTAGDEQLMLEEGSSLANIGDAELTRQQILEAIMLPSGNDAAYCAAAVTGKIIADKDRISVLESVNTFVDKMNEKATELGCKNTHFTCPDGFHDDDHYTTAADMIRLVLYSREFPEVAETGSKSYVYDEFATGESIEWYNSNKLIDEDSEYYYTYATGLKTGMTDKSGYCVVATANRFGHELIIVCLGSETSEIRWRECTALFDMGFSYIRDHPERDEKKKSGYTADIYSETAAEDETAEDTENDEGPSDRADEDDER